MDESMMKERYALAKERLGGILTRGDGKGAIPGLFSEDSGISSDAC